MRIVAWILVGGVSFVSGGFAIPIGFALDLSAIEVYLAAVLGSTAGLVVFLFTGDKVRALLRKGEGRSRQPGPQLAERYGARGLGLIVFPGDTASVVVGLALGLGRSELVRWMSIGIAVMFALYTAGMWLLVEVVGLD